MAVNIDKLILDKVYSALVDMRDARDMLKEAAKKARKEEKDFTDDSPVKEAVESAMGELVGAMGFGSPLAQTLNQCVNLLAQELLCIGGVELDLEGAKIQLEAPKMPMPVSRVRGDNFPFAH